MNFEQAAVVKIQNHFTIDFSVFPIAIELLLLKVTAIF